MTEMYTATSKQQRALVLWAERIDGRQERVSILLARVGGARAAVTDVHSARSRMSDKLLRYTEACTSFESIPMLASRLLKVAPREQPVVFAASCGHLPLDFRRQSLALSQHTAPIAVFTEHHTQRQRMSHAESTRSKACSEFHMRTFHAQYATASIHDKCTAGNRACSASSTPSILNTASSGPRGCCQVVPSLRSRSNMIVSHGSGTQLFTGRAYIRSHHGVPTAYW